LPVAPIFDTTAFFAGACASTEPAADFAAALTRPSRITFDAVVASRGEVVFFGLTCESALPATDFEDLPVEGFSSNLAAFVATFGLVDLVAMAASSQCV